tara:strand:+ start:264 stop:365 length:102 start_codon:yes stop_codon:yes gene_type:complete
MGLVQVSNSVEKVHVSRVRVCFEMRLRDAFTLS